MNHAIVMGGSIAGLCAAAALAKQFDRVTVIERDPEPGFKPHRGAPQGKHIHVLMSRGQVIMDELFPGAFDGLLRDGALRREAGTSARWFQFGAWKKKAPIGIDSWYQSRPLLEHHLRESLKRNDKVELRFDIAVDEPIHTNGRVSGLRLRDDSILDGDLIVDATGRGSRSATWLERWGYGVVPEQRVRVGLGYVSGVFKRKPGSATAADEAIAVYQHAAVGNKRAGLSFPLENDHKVVTLVGYHGDHAPAEIGEFREWASTLLAPAIAEELDGLELVGKLHSFNYPEQIRRSYDEMRRLPEGYLVVGDAMCSLDPTFGQGMVIAAMQAEILGQRARPGKSTKRLQRKLCKLTAMPFTMTANEAYRWPETTGWKPRFSALQQAAIAKVFQAASDDSEIYGVLIRVVHFLTPATTLLRPKILWRVFAGRRPLPVIERPSSPFAGELSSPALTRTGS